MREVIAGSRPGGLVAVSMQSLHVTCISSVACPIHSLCVWCVCVCVCFLIIIVRMPGFSSLIIGTTLTGDFLFDCFLGVFFLGVAVRLTFVVDPFVVVRCGLYLLFSNFDQAAPMNVPPPSFAIF